MDAISSCAVGGEPAKTEAAIPDGATYFDVSFSPIYDL
jgi:hypothetical protein